MSADKVLSDEGDMGRKVGDRFSTNPCLLQRRHVGSGEENCKRDGLKNGESGYHEHSESKTRQQDPLEKVNVLAGNTGYFLLGRIFKHAPPPHP